VCLILTHVTPAAVKNTSSRGKGTNQRRWFGPQTWGSSIARCSSCSWRSEKGSIQQKVSFRPPIPTFPYGCTSIYSLCHLFTFNFPFLIKRFMIFIIISHQQHIATRNTITLHVYLFGERVCRSKVSVALAVNCGVSTTTNCIHFPVGIVIVNHVEIPVSASALSINKSCVKYISWSKNLFWIIFLGIWNILMYSKLHNLNYIFRFRNVSSKLQCRIHFIRSSDTFVFSKSQGCTFKTMGWRMRWPVLELLNLNGLPIAQLKTSGRRAQERREINDVTQGCKHPTPHLSKGKSII